MLVVQGIFHKYDAEPFSKNHAHVDPHYQISPKAGNNNNLCLYCALNAIQYLKDFHRSITKQDLIPEHTRERLVKMI